jgi:septal ring factor EnvC (AmiA/AmiB activator)
MLGGLWGRARLLLIVGLGLLAGACATGPCGPANATTDSLGCAARNMNNGTYDRERAEQQAAAAAMQQRAQTLAAENRQLSANVQQAKAQSASLRGQIAAQKAEIDSLDRQIAQAGQRGQIAAAELEERRRKIEQLRAAQRSLQDQPGDSPEMQQKVQALQREIEGLKASLARRAI